MATRMQQRRGTAAQWLSTNNGNGPVLNIGEIGYESDTNKFKIGDGVSHWIDLNYFADAVELGGSIDDYIPLTQKGAADGVATLDSNGVIPSEQIPSLVGLDSEITTAVNNAVNALVDGAPAALNTLNELAAAVNDNGDFASELIAEMNTKQDIVDGVSITEIGYLANVNSDIQTQIDSKANSADIAESAIDALAGALTEGTDIVITHDDNANTITIAAGPGLATNQELADSVSNHNNDTTNVHGIDDTAELATKTFAANLLVNATKTNIEITGDKDGITIVAENGVADSTTDNLAEGTTNKYYTDARVETKLSTSVRDGIAWDNVTNELYVDEATVQFRVTDVSDTEIGYLNGVTSAIQTQIDGKQDVVSGVSSTEIGYLDGVTSAIQTQIDEKAPLASPTFTGTVNAADLIISGDLTVSGTTTTVSAQDLVVSDPLIYIGEGNTANLVDLGFVASFDDGTYQHAGLAKDATDGIWKLFKGVTDEPTTTINFTQGSLDDLAINNLEAADATFTGTVTGVTASMVGLGNVDNTADADKPVSTATQTALDTKLDSIVSINAQTGNYTLVLGDKDKMVEMNVGSANTLTVPANADVAYPVGTKINIVQTGSGQTTLTAGSGVTINATPGLKTRAQWSAVTIVKRATDTWVAFGDLTA